MSESSAEQLLYTVIELKKNTVNKHSSKENKNEACKRVTKKTSVTRAGF